MNIFILVVRQPLVSCCSFLCLLGFVVLVIVVIDAEVEPCCQDKTVGGVQYVLKNENTGMTSGYGCIQDCIYVRFVPD